MVPWSAAGRPGSETARGFQEEHVILFRVDEREHVLHAHKRVVAFFDHHARNGFRGRFEVFLGVGGVDVVEVVLVGPPAEPRGDVDVDGLRATALHFYLLFAGLARFRRDKKLTGLEEWWGQIATWPDSNTRGPTWFWL